MKSKSTLKAKGSTDFDPTAYTITIQKVAIDGESFFKGSVAELPDVESFESTSVDAYNIVLDAISTLYQMAFEKGRAFPRPRSNEEEFSGRVSLRLPRTLHRKASLMADKEGVSLNQYFVALIAEGIGERAAQTRTLQPIFIVGGYEKEAFSSSVLNQIHLSSKKIDITQQQWIHK